MKLALATVLVAALGAVATGATNLSDVQRAALTTIDTLPSTAQLEIILNAPDHASAESDLAAIAKDASVDVGIRLRAVHALSNPAFCPSYPNPCDELDPVHVDLKSLITANKDQHAGSDLLVLRAAIESIAPLEVLGDMDLLVPLLNHPSRDIRAATAYALGEVQNCQAINELRVRYQNESTDQVKLAISATLRVLSQKCP